MSPSVDDNTPSDSADALPLPVQDMNIEMMQQSSDDVPVDWTASQGSDVSSACHSSLSTDVVVGPVASDIPPWLCTEAAILPPTSQVPASLRGRLAQASNAASQWGRSVPAYSSQQVCTAPNGLVIPAVKTPAGTRGLADSGTTAATSNTAPAVAPGTSGNIHRSSSSRVAPARTHGGQFVHLTIPPTLNLTGTNIQIRQFVSVPSPVTSSTSCGRGSVPSACWCTADDVCTVPPCDTVGGASRTSQAATTHADSSLLSTASCGGGALPLTGSVSTVGSIAIGTSQAVITASLSSGMQQFVSIEPRSTMSSCGGGVLPACWRTSLYMDGGASGTSQAVTTTDVSPPAAPGHTMLPGPVPQHEPGGALSFHSFHQTLPELFSRPVSCSDVSSARSAPGHPYLPGPLQQQQSDTTSFHQTLLPGLRVSCSSMVTSAGLTSVDSGGHVLDTMTGELTAACSTPPACHDENSRLDSTTGCDVDALSVMHASIPDIPTPDPSCSSQE